MYYHIPIMKEIGTLQQKKKKKKKKKDPIHYFSHMEI